MTLALILGGGLALFMCCTCGGGVGGFLIYTALPRAHPIVGKWQATQSLTMEFKGDGTGSLTSTLPHPNGQMILLRSEFTYRYHAGPPETLEMTTTSIEGMGIDDITRKQKIGHVSRSEVVLADDTLKVKGNPAPIDVVWRRVR